HVDPVLGAGADAVAAEDAAKQIDVVAHRDLLARALVFARFDGDALRGARRRAHVAGHAARGAVLARGENVPAAEALGVDALHFGVRDDGQSLVVRQVV